MSRDKLGGGGGRGVAIIAPPPGPFVWQKAALSTMNMYTLYNLYVYCVLCVYTLLMYYEQFALCVDV